MTTNKKVLIEEFLLSSRKKADHVPTMDFLFRLPLFFLFDIKNAFHMCCDSFLFFSPLPRRWSVSAGDFSFMPFPSDENRLVKIFHARARRDENCNFSFLPVKREASENVMK